MYQSKRIVITTAIPVANMNRIYEEYLAQKAVKEFESRLNEYLLEGYRIFYSPIRPKSNKIPSKDDKFILITKTRVWFSEHIVKLAEMSSYYNDIMDIASNVVFKRGRYELIDFLIKASVHIETGEEVPIYGFPIKLFEDTLEYLR